jgi:hypothetical protein
LAKGSYQLSEAEGSHGEANLSQIEEKMGPAMNYRDISENILAREIRVPNYLIML